MGGPEMAYKRFIWVILASFSVVMMLAGGCGSSSNPECPVMVFEGNVHIQSDSGSPEDLRGYTKVNGTVHIFGIQDTNLDALSCLGHVTGDLHIDMENLTSLAGLGRLTTIDGTLGIYHCAQLESLAGLENLTTVGGDYIDISFNSKLPLCEVEALVERLRANGFTGNAETSYNDETAVCE
jgi:hypothetical protein